MSTSALKPNRYISQRRSQRVLSAVRVLMEGHRPDGHSFQEETQTVVVNAHGALVLLVESVNVAESLTMLNLKSGEQVPCRVTDVGSAHNGKHEVGIEFLEPSARFWRVAFPPEDWSPHSPEAKRRTTEPVSYSKVAPVNSPKSSSKK